MPIASHARTVPTLYGFRIFDYWTWTNRPNAEDYELRPRVAPRSTGSSQ